MDWVLVGMKESFQVIQCEYISYTGVSVIMSPTFSAVSKIYKADDHRTTVKCS